MVMMAIIIGVVNEEKVRRLQIIFLEQTNNFDRNIRSDGVGVASEAYETMASKQVYCTCFFKSLLIKIVNLIVFFFVLGYRIN